MNAKKVAACTKSVWDDFASSLFVQFVLDIGAIVGGVIIATALVMGWIALMHTTFGLHGGHAMATLGGIGVVGVAVWWSYDRFRFYCKEYDEQHDHNV